MKRILSLGLPLGLLAAFNVSACQGSGEEAHARGPSAQSSAHENEDDDDAGEVEEDIALDAIPPAVRAAALAAVPGFVIKEAEKETAGGAVTYCLEEPPAAARSRSRSQRTGRRSRSSTATTTRMTTTTARST